MIIHYVHNSSNCNALIDQQQDGHDPIDEIIINEEMKESSNPAGQSQMYCGNLSLKTTLKI